MLLAILAFVAVAFTCTMFFTKNMLLGFPSAMFFSVLGGYCYTRSAATWDMYYFTFFASFGMALFLVLAMYALRKSDLKNPDIGKTRYIDEAPGRTALESHSPAKTTYADEDEDEESPRESPRSRALHDRAARRRTETVRVKRSSGGEFK